MLGVSKQAYHKQKFSSGAHKAMQEVHALEIIHSIRVHDPGMGGLTLWHAYREACPSTERMGRDRFEDLIHRHGLKVRQKIRKPRTTDSSHGLRVYPNLAYDFIPTEINQLWVSDITYIPVWISKEEYTFSYLSLTMDAYSHEIIGWAVGATLETAHTIEALKMALGRVEAVRDTVAGKLIHHSDRGIQYASKAYIDLLGEYSIRVSMTENGNPKDNAMAERVNGTIKNELLKDMTFKSVNEVREAVGKAVDYYNKCRPHMSLDMKTPEQAAKCKGSLRKLCKSYRENAIKKAASYGNS